MKLIPVLILLFVTTSFSNAQPVSSLSQSIAAIKAVDHRGKGHEQARQAVRQLQQQDASALLPILLALDDANPLASNWLRNAFETIAAGVLENNKPLPEEELLSFLRQTKHRPASRRMVFEWLQKIDPDQTEQMVDMFINDPSDELRREAVSRYIKQAEKIAKEKPDDKTGRSALYKKALSGASDDDQVRKIIKGLKECGEEIDLQYHYGFLNSWNLIGPFNNKDGIGFAKVYPPEKEVNASASYEGQLGEVTWQKYETDDSYGVLDIAKQVGPHKGAVEYAYTEFYSDKKQPVEFRLATPNAWKLWVNGKLLFEREEYHRGTAFDQYRVPGELKKGKNTILLKICQNEQTQDWAQRWQIQFRVCNPFGMAIHSTETNK